MTTIPILLNLSPDDRMKLDELSREMDKSRSAVMRGLIRSASENIKTQPAQPAGGLVKVYEFTKTGP